MTNPSFPTNKAIVYAVVDTRPQNAKERRKGLAPEAAIRRFRNEAGGTAYNVQLQVLSPYGTSYGITVELNNAIPGAEATLAIAQPGTALVLEGHLQRMESVDSRFASFDEEAVDGVHYRDVMLRVSSLRTRTDTDPQGLGSQVWVEGTVIEPPAVFRHPNQPEILFARMRLRTQTPLAATGAGTFGLKQTCEVTVIVPTDSEEAEKLYVQGNRVRIRGLLDRLAITHGGADVRKRLAEIDTQWATHQAELASDPRGLRQAGQRYLREKQRLQQRPSTMLIAAEVELIQGETQDLDTATQARTAFLKTQRSARNARRAQSANRAAAPAPDVSGPTPETETPQRPRRRAQALSEGAEAPEEASVIVVTE